MIWIMNVVTLKTFRSVVHYYKMSTTNLPPSASCQEGSDPSSDPGKLNRMFSPQTAPSSLGSSHQTPLQPTGPRKKKETHSFLTCTHHVNLFDVGLCGDLLLYLFLQPCPSNDLTCNCSKVWVKFESDELGVRGQQAGDAHCGVATVGPQL